MSLLPHPFLFRFTLRALRAQQIPLTGKRLLNLGEEYRLPYSGELDGKAPWADVRVGWNAGGLGVSVSVSNKASNRGPAWREEMNRLEVWVDTRNTQTIHRATRFCHRFAFYAIGGGADRKSAWAKQLAIPRAKEEANPVDPISLGVVSEIRRGGYTLEAWIPDDALHGFDPASNPQLGFCYVAYDAEFGAQPLTVDHTFPIDGDPSLWSTLELRDE